MRTYQFDCLIWWSHTALSYFWGWRWANCQSKSKEAYFHEHDLTDTVCEEVAMYMRHQKSSLVEHSRSKFRAIAVDATTLEFKSDLLVQRGTHNYFARFSSTTFSAILTIRCLFSSIPTQPMIVWYLLKTWRNNKCIIHYHIRKLFDHSLHRCLGN